MAKKKRLKKRVVTLKQSQIKQIIKNPKKTKYTKGSKICQQFHQILIISAAVTKKMLKL